MTHSSPVNETPPRFYIVNQHIGWLKQYILGMDEKNWRDMRVRAENQLESLSEEIDKEEAADLVRAQRMPEPVVWQYRVLHDKGHILENVWCEWHQTSQSYYEKCCAEIASGNTRLQVRPLYAFTSPGRGQP